MALFKKVEFAAECRVSKAHVSVAITRGKIIVREDKLIDSKNEINRLYIERCLENKARQPDKPKDVTTGQERGKVAKSKRSKPQEPAEIPNRAEDPTKSARITQKFDVELQEKQARIEKMRLDARLMEMKEAKLTGQLIPTDLVFGTIRQLTQSLLVNFNNSTDAWLVDLAKKLKIDRAMLADLRKDVKKVLNSSVDMAVTDAQKNVENITKEYSQRKNAA
jgi:hypothetical protein